MRRRTLITAFGASWVPFSGCLSRDADEDGTPGGTNGTEGDETNDSEENGSSRDTDPGDELLTLEPVEPKRLPQARSVSVEHALDGERTVSLGIVAEDGTVLIDETRSLRPSTTVEFGETARVGTHEIRIGIEDSEAIETGLTGALRIDESHFDRIIVVEPDGLFVTGGVADLVRCQFEK